MSAKTSAEVIIGGKVYTLSGYESEEYLQKVAGYINNKLSDFNEIKEYRHLPVPMKATLVELNIADDYFKAKARVEKLEDEIEHKEKTIYDLKHDLISEQIKTQTVEATVKKLESEKQELQLDKARLETALEDSARMTAEAKSRQTEAAKQDGLSEDVPDVAAERKDTSVAPDGQDTKTATTAADTRQTVGNGNPEIVRTVNVSEPGTQERRGSRNYTRRKPSQSN